MKPISVLSFIICMLSIINISVGYAQSNNKAPTILVDVSHGQRFWNNPNNMVKNSGSNLERTGYLDREITQTASVFNGAIKYLTSDIDAKTLSKTDMLFIHVPSTMYSTNELKVISQYLKRGGALFLIMDADHWSTLEQTNVNDIIAPFDIKFKGNSVENLISGGYTTPGAITDKKLKVTYSNGRILEGGKSFCYSVERDESFGVYKALDGGGKVVVMGDAMVSLYMTEWMGVKDYQCQEFMQAVFRWLLE